MRTYPRFGTTPCQARNNRRNRTFPHFCPRDSAACRFPQGSGSVWWVLELRCVCPHLSQFPPLPWSPHFQLADSNPHSSVPSNLLGRFDPARQPNWLFLSLWPLDSEPGPRASARTLPSAREACSNPGPGTLPTRPHTAGRKADGGPAALRLAPGAETWTPAPFSFPLLCACLTDSPHGGSTHSATGKSALLIVQLINDHGWPFPVEKMRQGPGLYVVQLTRGDSGKMTYLSLLISVSAQWRDNNRIYLMQLFQELNELTYARDLEQCLAQDHP